MTMYKSIDKKELLKRIAELSKEFQVIGPKALLGKGIFYQPISNADELYLGGEFTIEPVKKYFLSPSEFLFKADYKQGKDCVEEIALPGNKVVLFGVRPCEARGLTLLDKVFNSEYKDASYVNNRERSVIVGLACAQPDKACFCTSMNGTPAESRGMDALLYDMDDRFIVEICTDKGKQIFGPIGKELDEAQKKSLAEFEKKKKDLIANKFKAPDDLMPAFANAYWGKVSSACLSCGICTYLCPTCHCFDLVDEERKKLRCYDGCAFADFTVEASGVNPRPTKKERYRQRLFHKFDYFKKNFGENLCVGCGRCIRHCPVKIDISEIAAHAPTD